MNYKIGQWVKTKELGIVKIGKIGEKGEVLEVITDENIFIRSEDLPERKITILKILGILNFIEKIITGVKEFIININK